MRVRRCLLAFYCVPQCSVNRLARSVLNELAQGGESDPFLSRRRSGRSTLVGTVFANSTLHERAYRLIKCVRMENQTMDEFCGTKFWVSKLLIFPFHRLPSPPFAFSFLSLHFGFSSRMHIPLVAIIGGRVYDLRKRFREYIFVQRISLYKVRRATVNIRIGQSRV